MYKATAYNYEHAGISMKDDHLKFPLLFLIKLMSENKTENLTFVFNLLYLIQ